MGKGYSIDKVKKTQEKRDEIFEKRNAGANIFDGLSQRFEGKEAFNIAIKKLYAAPNEWNFFKQLNDSQTYEMIDSIEKEGLMNPILVWKKKRNQIELLDDVEDSYDLTGEEYMILAGHNRVNVYKLLHEQTKDNKYLEIPAFIYEDIDDERAKYIIIASNYVQRALSKEDRRQSIAYMYRNLNESSDKTLNVAETIAKQTNMSPRSVYDELNITKNLIPYFIELYDSGRISKVNALKLTNFTKSMQKYIVDNYEDRISNDTLKQLYKPYDKKEQIDKVFQVEEQIQFNKVDVNIEVPSHLEKRFKEMAKRWIARQIKSEKNDNYSE